VYTDSWVVGGVDGSVVGCEHGGEGASGGSVCVGIKFLEHDLGVRGEFDGLGGGGKSGDGSL
jgi:hypothetical protein